MKTFNIMHGAKYSRASDLKKTLVDRRSYFKTPTRCLQRNHALGNQE